MKRGRRERFGYAKTVVEMLWKPSDIQPTQEEVLSYIRATGLSIETEFFMFAGMAPSRYQFAPIHKFISDENSLLY